MTDYISREKLLERIDGIYDCADMVFAPNDKCCRADDCASCKWRETKNAIRKIVEYFPAADVRPVKRGKWIDHDFVDMGKGRYTGSVECSVCHRFLPLKEHYCPNCGSEMVNENE